MFLYFLAFIGGVLTIVSPCILPVLPFVFSRADQPFRKSALPLLAGMGLTFVLVATLASVAGTWVVRANQLGRYAALAIFAVLGLALLSPALAEYLSRPFVRLGSRIQGPRIHGSETAAPGIGRSVLLGISTGLLWTPCAGPILGLILTTAAVSGANLQTLSLLAAFALGAICSLAVVLFAGNRVFAALKHSLRAEAWIRRTIGVAVLLGVVAIAFGWDTGFLARLSLTTTSGLEQSLLDRANPARHASNVSPDSAMSMKASNVSNVAPDAAMSMKGANVSANAAMSMKGSATPPSASAAASPALEDDGALPSLSGAVGWLNSPPLTREALAGKVVVVDFWTYSCINCLRSIPYVEAWAEKYKKDGLVVIGVHTPEFAFEKVPSNVAAAVKSLNITYPVAIDSNYAIWKAFDNEYWPAHYFIDARGAIRYHHFGEGDYDKSEQIIQVLLKEKDASLQAGGLVHVDASGAEAAPDMDDIRSPETYIGYARARNDVSPQKITPDAPASYTVPLRLNVNDWGLQGKWSVGDEYAVLSSAPGKIAFRFHARDLHLVLGPGPGGKPVRFRVLLDGAPPADDGGVDVNSQGQGMVRDYRLYQLIRQKGQVEDRTFQIEFLDPGVQAFAFTFG